jgi:hypothetical protein
LLFDLVMTDLSLTGVMGFKSILSTGVTWASAMTYDVEIYQLADSLLRKYGLPN